VVAGRLRIKAGVGLVSAFGLQMVILHWLAAAIYLLPWYWNLDLRVVFAGLRESTWAMGGFAIGVLAIGFLGRQRAPVASSQENLADRKLIRFYLVVGVICYFGLTRVVGATPTLSAIVNVASTCAIVGIVLACWNAQHQHGGAQPWWWLIIAALLPFVTIAVQGFIGYGLAA